MTERLREQIAFMSRVYTMKEKEKCSGTNVLEILLENVDDALQKLRDYMVDCTSPNVEDFERLLFVSVEFDDLCESFGYDIASKDKRVERETL